MHRKSRIELDNNSRIQKLSKPHPRSFLTLKVDAHKKRLAKQINNLSRISLIKSTKKNEMTLLISVLQVSKENEHITNRWKRLNNLQFRICHLIVFAKESFIWKRFHLILLTGQHGCSSPCQMRTQVAFPQILRWLFAWMLTGMEEMHWRPYCLTCWGYDQY